jgi:hypothetical protein
MQVFYLKTPLPGEAVLIGLRVSSLWLWRLNFRTPLWGVLMKEEIAL